MPTGDSVAYVAGSTPIPVPHADDLTYRKAHTPPPPKPKGLDWDALKQTCDVCGQKASDVLDGTCGRCRKGIPTATPTPTADAVDVDEDLGGWTINRIPGMRITKNVTATAPGCPNGPHPTRDCACHVFTTTDEARDYIDAQLYGLDVDVDEGPETVVTPYADTYQVLDEHDVAARFTPPTRPAEPATDPVENHATPAPTVRAKVTQAQPGPGVLIALSGPVTTTQVSALLTDLLTALNTHQTPGAGVNATNPPSASGPVGTKDAHQAEVLSSSAGAPAPAPAPHTSGTEVTPGGRSPAAPGDFPTSVPEPHTSEGGDRKGKPAPPPGFTTFQRPASNANSRNPVDENAIVREYQAGDTPPAIARRHGCTPARVRAILDRHNIPRRDDRKGHTGGHHKPYPHTPEQVEQVRHLYVDQQLTIDQVAEHLDLTHKIVAGILRRHDIPRRPHAFTSEGHPRRDNAGALKDKMNALGVTSRQVKQWALEQGLIEPPLVRGVPPQRLVDAYASAHPAPGETP